MYGIGTDWVENATLLRDSTNNIKMKPAPTGQQFLQWEIYVNNVLQTNANDVEVIFAEQTRLHGLSRNITIKATYYTPDSSIVYTLTIERKDGTVEQHNYSTGTDIPIRASNPDQGYEFYKWTGDVAYIAGGAYESESYVHMPAKNIQIKETYVPEGYVPEFDLEMKGLYGQCCYTTSSTDPDTGEIVTTDHWVNRWSYPEGTIVRIRATGYGPERDFSEWNAVNHDTSADARSIITRLFESETTLIMPKYDVDATPVIPLKQTYELRINNGEISGMYYANKKCDVYFDKESTNDVHYEFVRWIGETGTDITTIELWDGGIFDPLTPGTSTLPQQIKMPAKRTEITANYKTKYRITLTNGIIDETSTSQGYYEAGTILNITATPPSSGMTFQYWTGDTSRVTSIYDPTPTVTTTTGITNLTAVYSTNTERNSIGYVTTDLKSQTTINNENITMIAGEIEIGTLITDSNGHIYIITNINQQDDISTIYRMTKIVRGGNIYD